jgi:hypothetical protein
MYRYHEVSLYELLSREESLLERKAGGGRKRKSHKSNKRRLNSMKRKLKETGSRKVSKY